MEWDWCLRFAQGSGCLRVLCERRVPSDCAQAGHGEMGVHLCTSTISHDRSRKETFRTRSTLLSLQISQGFPALVYLSVEAHSSPTSSLQLEVGLSLLRSRLSRSVDPPRQRQSTLKSLIAPTLKPASYVNLTWGKARRAWRSP